MGARSRTVRLLRKFASLDAKQRLNTRRYFDTRRDAELTWYEGLRGGASRFVVKLGYLKHVVARNDGEILDRKFDDLLMESYRAIASAEVFHPSEWEGLAAEAGLVFGSFEGKPHIIWPHGPKQLIAHYAHGESIPNGWPKPPGYRAT